MLRFFVLFALIVCAQTVRAQCYAGSLWRMGDGTEHTHNGRLSASGEFQTLYMNGPARTEDGDPRYLNARFNINSSALLPPGTYTIKYSRDYVGSDDVAVMQAIGATDPMLSLDDPYDAQTLTINKTGYATLAVSGPYVEDFSLRVSRLMFCTDDVVQFLEQKQVSGWQALAVAFLSRDGKPGVNLTAGEMNAHQTLRCIRLNNYWCLKDMGWVGRIGADADRHTAFSTPIWGARAAARNFRTAYTVHGRKSALAIMSKYSPAADCKGSTAARREDGTCVAGYNPTVAAAHAVARGITDDIDEDLGLVDASGNLTSNMQRFLSNLSLQETGLRPMDHLIEEGIRLEAQ